MSAPRADRAGDAELCTALGSEHHEDQEDQEDSRGDRERPECREESHECVPGRVGILDRICLESLDLEPQLLHHRLKQGDHLVREAGSGDIPALIRHCDERDLTLAVEQLLRLVERHEHGHVGGACAVEPHDVTHSS